VFEKGRLGHRPCHKMSIHLFELVFGGPSFGTYFCPPNLTEFKGGKLETCSKFQTDHQMKLMVLPASCMGIQTTWKGTPEKKWLRFTAAYSHTPSWLEGLCHYILLYPHKAKCITSPVCVFKKTIRMLVFYPPKIGCFPWLVQKKSHPLGPWLDLAEPYQVRPRNLPRKKSSPCRAAWDGHHWGELPGSLHFKRSNMSENKNQNVMI
jgi:hypothetical protein